MSNVPFHESMNYFVLLDLERKLKRLDYDKLKLRYLELLREEVREAVHAFHEKHKGDHF